MPIERAGTIAGLLLILCSIAASLAVSMDRLATVRTDVAELRQDVQKLHERQEQIMQAIGEIEHSRWRERHP